jgi:hypothetical protein
MKLVRRSLLTLVGLIVFVLLSWAYTNFQVRAVSTKGVYDSPEQGMREILSKYYSADQDVKILYAGPNSKNGHEPQVWYVIAEVRATARADGTALGANGCEAPGSFFLQTKEGWVHVSEGAMPGFINFWMKIFNKAGTGQATPTTDWGDHPPEQFCR